VKHDLYHNVAVVQLLKPQSINDTDTKSSILDTAGFQSAALLFNMGVFTGADADSFVLPTFQESDTTVDGDFTTVAAADLHGAFTLVDSTSEDETSQYVGYKGNKRYIRLLANFTTGSGGVSAALMSVTGLLGDPTNAPVSAPAALAAT
jgi:hypothetical protein